MIKREGRAHGEPVEPAYMARSRGFAKWPGSARCSGAPPPPPPPGRTAVSIIGTPFLIAFKIPVCIVSAAMAGAMTGVAGALGGNGGPASLEQSLGEGVEKNCGPPWALNP